MQKFTQKQLKELVKSGAAVDVTRAGDRNMIPEPYSRIGFVSGVYGCSGLLLKGDKTGKLYAVTARSSAVDIF